MNLYLIAWKSNLTGHCGIGKAYMGYQEAELVVKYYNKIYPGIEHYISY